MMITSILRNLTTLGCVVAMASIGTPARAASKGLVAFSQAEMTNEWRVMDTKEMEKAWKDAGYDFTWTDANPILRSNSRTSKTFWPASRSC